MGKKKALNLSVAIATYNEAAYLSGCLESVKNLADEIVVVDGGSTDDTRGIAERFGANVIVTDNPAIFHINKQKALDVCRGAWILQLDADERVTEALAAEIREVTALSDANRKTRTVSPGKLRLFSRHQRLIEARDGVVSSKDGDIVAYYVPRRNYFLGHPMTYAGMYPDGVIRLMKNGRARFPARNVHEQIQIEGSVSWLESDLTHLSNPTFGRYWRNADRYTNLQSVDLSSQKVSGGLLLAVDCVLVKPVTTFFALFIRHKGILDGIYGLLFALFSSWHYPIAYWKYLTRR